MARHITNFTKSSENIALDLVNEQNNKNLALTEVQFSVSGQLNTKASTLVVFAKIGSGYKGSASLDYNRLFFSEIPDQTAVEYETTEIRTSAVIQAINAAYQLNIGFDDIESINGVPYVSDPTEEEDPVITLNYETNTPITVVASAGSLVWVGEHDFQFIATSMELSQAWPNNNLDGFNPPPPAE